MTREAIAVSGDIAPESGVGARDTHDSLLGLLWAAALLCRDETEAAVRETLAAILPAIPHGLDKLRGDPADCAQV